MHFLALVTGENVDEQLWQFSVHNEVKPYEVWLSREEIERMSQHYNVSPNDLLVLSEKMQDWEGSLGFVRDGRLGYISTHNPKAHLDWHRTGGQWEGFLKLKQPRRVRRFFGLLPPRTTLKASAARKSEIDQEALLADPPSALVHQGEWFASEAFPTVEALETWKVEFARQFARIPAETMLTVVGVHN